MSDVFTPVNRVIKYGTENVKKASRLASSDANRHVLMEDAAQRFRNAAYQLDNIVLAEKEHSKSGFSLWQLDIEGAETPVII